MFMKITNPDSGFSRIAGPGLYPPQLEFLKLIRDETHHEVQLITEELQGSHGGDCVCWPCTCFKCLAEDHLGISTTKGLGKHEGSYIMGAFGKNRDRTIDEAIESLKVNHSYETRDKVWDKYPREEYEKHIPRWESERKNALEWLEAYKKEHGF